MKRLFLPLVLLLVLAHASPAFAQWQFSAEAGARYVRMTETGTDNRTMVQEYGWLPGIGGAARYATQGWQFGVSGDFYRNDITYDGRLQSGASFVSETGTTQARIRLEIGRQVSEAVQLIAALERDVWQRDIRGRDGVAGLQERYTSWRLLTGATGRVAQWSAGSLDLTGLIVFARPEQMRVQFDRQLFDDASLSTKSAVGLRFGLGFQPAALPNLTLQADLDWIDIGRSDKAVLRRNGNAVGTITQPRHERAAFGLRAVYRFQ
ncbi:hypothetical protein D3870_18220 [Noviherbaspirillum cavernae]|uniref:Outer membrane protein beta-barrel domain-containing protein n=1 Tax=Noviherbaspirillum cavernae TaxID=2320862 RepID=A0A418X5C6_9BURK|nr:hypothetical protein [Noviherbaspirillum cavernae]RJG07672.1 hypothetical protein D3870_18220 [Noviherbaspirillum cavernae]